MKEKSDNLIKTPSKIQSFEEVQKALQDLAKQLNDLGIATNSSAEGEITDKDGKTGDIRITQNEDKTYGLELKTEEGWKFPTVGESPVQLTGKKGEKARPDAVVDKFKDEAGSPKNLPRPDYDSGFFNIELSKQYVTGATDGVVPEDSFIYHAAHVVGIPALGFSLTDAPSCIQIMMAPWNEKSFDNAMTSKILILDWQNQYYSNNEMGVRCWMTSPEHICFATSDAWLYHAKHAGGHNVASDTATLYDAFDTGGSSQNLSMRVKMWK